MYMNYKWVIFCTMSSLYIILLRMNRFKKHTFHHSCISSTKLHPDNDINCMKHRCTHSICSNGQHATQKISHPPSGGWLRYSWVLASRTWAKLNTKFQLTMINQSVNFSVWFMLIFSEKRTEMSQCRELNFAQKLRIQLQNMARPSCQTPTDNVFNQS